MNKQTQTNPSEAKLTLDEALEIAWSIDKDKWREHRLPKEKIPEYMNGYVASVFGNIRCYLRRLPGSGIEFQFTVVCGRNPFKSRESKQSFSFDKEIETPSFIYNNGDESKPDSKPGIKRIKELYNFVEDYLFEKIDAREQAYQDRTIMRLKKYLQNKRQEQGGEQRK